MLHSAFSRLTGGPSSPLLNLLFSEHVSHPTAQTLSGPGNPGVSEPACIALSSWESLKGGVITPETGSYAGWPSQHLYLLPPSFCPVWWFVQGDSVTRSEKSKWMYKQANTEQAVTSFLRALIKCLELVAYIRNLNQLKVWVHTVADFSVVQKILRSTGWGGFIILFYRWENWATESFKGIPSHTI